MRSWSRPRVDELPGTGRIPSIVDSRTGTAAPSASGPRATLYVCGITPYDATHLGHAATFIAYDLLVRAWLDAGLDVLSVQNSTDVDDPLLERATATGADWRELAAEQTELYRGDMESLAVVPPTHYVSVTESIAEIAAAVATLVERGIGYDVDGDIYFDSAAAARSGPWRLGDESRLAPATMLELAAERGGDPERRGKRDPLDPLLWRARRDGEPYWQSPVGEGRPGWHIECSVISTTRIGGRASVTGGGRDLLFPHHEFSAGHASALTGDHVSERYSHAGFVAFEGEKMSKSLGNLVFVSRLVASGVDPRAIRLVVLAEHYRSDWEFTDAHLLRATARLDRWSAWAAARVEHGAGEAIVAALREALAADLDAPAALRAVDELIGNGELADDLGIAAIRSLLGVDLDR